MYSTTDPDARQALHHRACASSPTTSTGTRALPVPAYGATILLHADAADDGGRAQVDCIARLLDAPVATRPPRRPLQGCPRLRPHRLPRSSPSPKWPWPATARRLLPRLRHPRHLDLTLKRHAQKEPRHAHHHPGLRQIRRRRQRPLHRRGLPGQRRRHPRRLPGLPRHHRLLQRLPLHLRVLALRRLHRHQTGTPPSPTSPPRYPSRPARPAATPTTSARPASPPASAPRNTRWNAATAARSGSHDQIRLTGWPAEIRPGCRRHRRVRATADRWNRQPVRSRPITSPVRARRRQAMRVYPGRLRRPGPVVAMKTRPRQDYYGLLGVRPDATVADQVGLPQAGQAIPPGRERQPRRR